jgi:hypothetical protein
MADAVMEFPEEARAVELDRRRRFVAELLSAPQIAAVYLDERTLWLLDMWADGSLGAEDLAGALEQHTVPLLAGLPGGADALELLRVSEWA